MTKNYKILGKYIKPPPPWPPMISDPILTNLTSKEIYSELITSKKELEKIILCDVQVEIYSDLEKSFLNLINNSGYPEVKFEKKINFEELYKQRFN